MSPLVIVAIVAVVLVVATGVVVALKRGGGPSTSPGAARQVAARTPAPQPRAQAAIAPDLASHFTDSRESKLDWLIGVEGDVAGREFHVKGGSVTIGRAPTNRVQTTDSQASREHCRLTPTGGGLLLEDLGSANGTLVNGRPMRKGELAYGDRITIGAATWIYEMQSRTADDNDAGAQERVRGAEARKATSLATDGASDDIDQALAAAGGDVEAAAEALGVTPQFIERLLAKRRREGSS